MESFIQQYEKDVIGHLSGFDRLVIRGTLRALASVRGMFTYLRQAGVLLKDFGGFVMEKTRLLKEATCAEAIRLNRPVQYLPSPKISKEQEARQIAQADGIKEGLICVLRSVEPCLSYEVFRNKEHKKLELVPRLRKCLFFYHYWIHPVFGFMNARIQSWFPFSVQVCLNGREWLARQMDQAGIRYDRLENCFPWIEDVRKAQALMEEQLRTQWPTALRMVARALNPAHEQIVCPFHDDYYWSTYQGEWATDVMFRSVEALQRIYPALVRHGICAFDSTEVMRFLGKKPQAQFKGEVITDYGKRVEGIRLKHQLKSNSLKLYDKYGRVLRGETTVNDPRDFKVYRPKEGDPQGPQSWRPMRKGVADLHRLAQISQASNERYFQALACVKVDRLVGDVVESVCRPARWKGRRVRPLRPWSKEDTALLRAINRAQFNIAGLRNRDLVSILFPGEHFPQIKRRLGARVSHRLRILRAHGIIRKVHGTHRYQLTPKGRQVATAVIYTQHIPIARLSEIAA